MKTGTDIVDLAKQHIGEQYIFGTLVAKDNAMWRGPWDCAEFASWLVYQLTGKLYGCYDDNGKADSADAYTGYWVRDAQAMGQMVSISEAAQTPGAFMLRKAAGGVTGHIVVCDGTGGTVEAHSTRSGVIASTLDGRRWDYGILVPGIDYNVITSTPSPLLPKGVIYRYKQPMMHGDTVELIQSALNAKGNKLNVDGWYGVKTFAAVRMFQIMNGLVADGEVGQATWTALFS